MNRRGSALVLATALLAAACASSESARDEPNPSTTATVASSDDSAAASQSTPTTDGSTPTEAPRPGDRPATLSAVSCGPGLDDAAVTCGIAEVALDPSDPAGSTTQISYVVVTGSDGNFPTPVAVMQGGPGGASSEMAVWFPQRDFTQVFVDQRGTGFAETDLDCVEANGLASELLELPSTEAALEFEDAYESCAVRLAGTDVLPYTNTASHAADVEAVMAALGHDRWIAYGVSYGSTIALQLMRDSAAGLVGSVLDGVYPPDLDVDAGLAASADRSIGAVSAACRDDDSCNGIVDDVANTLDRLIVELNSDPLAVSPGSGVPDTDLDGQRLAEYTFLMLYSEREVARIPWILDGLDRRDDKVAEWLVRVGTSIQDLTSDSNDEGTYFAVQCHDRLPFSDGIPDDLGPFAAAVAATSTDEICQPWSVGSASDADGLPVESSIPTLLLSGGFDPITPVDYARSAAVGLSNSTVVEQAGRGHGIWFGNDCIGGIVFSFVSDPTRSLDVSCASDPVPVKWLEP